MLLSFYQSSDFKFLIFTLLQGCHGQGKVREIPVFLRVREKSGNFVICYQSQGKVREFRLWCLLMHIFHHLANDIWTKTKSWIRFTFKYHLPNDVFQNFISFHVLHNGRHKISTIFKMLKMFSCADLFSRPLHWSIYWWMMWFFLWFWIYSKNHHRVHIATVTGICVWSQGNVREKSGNFFLPTPWQPCFIYLKYTPGNWRKNGWWK